MRERRLGLGKLKDDYGSRRLPAAVGRWGWFRHYFGGPNRNLVPSGVPPGRILSVLADGGQGGAEAVVFRVVPFVCREGWEARVWLPAGGLGEARAADSGASVAAIQRPIRYSLRGMREPPGTARRLLATPGYLWAFVRELKRWRPTAVHANTYYTLPEATVARLLGYRTVLHIHDIPPPGLKTKTILWWAKTVASSSIACSHAAAEPLRASGADVRVIFNGVSDSTNIRDGSVAQGPLTVGTVARIEHRKGIDIFLDSCEIVARAVPEVQFKIWGPDGLGRDALYAAGIRERVRLMKEAGVAVEVGFEPDASSRVSSWSVFVLASRQDPFPLAVLEAMAAGVPVVASRTGGIPEQIVHGRSGLLVPPEDPGAMAAAILKLCLRPGTRQQLAAGGVERARRFSLAQQAEEMLDVFAGRAPEEGS